MTLSETHHRDLPPSVAGSGAGIAGFPVVQTLLPRLTDAELGPETKCRRVFRNRTAGLGMALLAALLAAPSEAAPVAANGAFTFSTPGVNTVDTGNITLATAVLTLGNAFPGFGQVTAFADPFQGNANNFCRLAVGGCAAAHAPGFLDLTTTTALNNPTLPVGSNVTLPVGNITPTPITLVSTFTTDVGGSVGLLGIVFDFSSIVTTGLTPTTATSAGTITLDFAATLSSDSDAYYTAGQAAGMSITCTQAALAAEIVCTGEIAVAALSASPDPVPEPSTIALFGAGLVGLGAALRRR